MIIFVIPAFVAIGILTSTLIQIQLQLAALDSAKQRWFKKASAVYDTLLEDPPREIGYHKLQMQPLEMHVIIPHEELGLETTLVVLNVRRY